MTMQQWAQGDAAPWSKVNENFDAIAQTVVYAKDVTTSTGLTWGYFGGRWGGNSISAGTHTLTNASDNYIVAARSNGAASVSTSSTNWNDTTNYARVYKVTTAGSVVTATEDHRAGTYGVHGGGGGSGSTEFRALTFTSDTGSTADSDPGAGLFKWNNATQASATELYVDDATVDSVTMTALWAAISTTGMLFLQQSDDSTRWQMWKYTAFTDASGYAKFTSMTLMGKGSDIQDDKLCYFLPLGASGGGTSTAGTQDLWIPAAAMHQNIDSGPPVGAGSTAIRVPGNRINIVYIPFDQTTQEAAQFSIRMPKKWNEGTLTFTPLWTAESGSGGVVWRLKAAAVSDDDALSVVMGTEVSSTDTFITASDLHIGPTSSAMTVASSPATRDLVLFEVDRAVSDGSDTLNADAQLLGITLHITTDAENDA